MITFKLSDNRQWKEPWLIHRSVYLINNEIRTDQLPAFSQIKRIVRPIVICPQESPGRAVFVIEIHLRLLDMGIYIYLSSDFLLLILFIFRLLLMHQMYFCYGYIYIYIYIYFSHLFHVSFRISDVSSTG